MCLNFVSKPHHTHTHNNTWRHFSFFKNQLYIKNKRNSIYSNFNLFATLYTVDKKTARIKTLEVVWKNWRAGWSNFRFFLIFLLFSFVVVDNIHKLLLFIHFILKKLCVHSIPFSVKNNCDQICSMR